MTDWFVARSTAPESLDEPAHWFVFQGNQILVRREQNGAGFPCVAQVRDLGLEPTRTQYLGELKGRHCFSGECPAEAAAPDGYAWSGLRGLFGLVDDVLFGLAGRAFQIMDWDRSHQYCGRCGTPTISQRSERSRECPKCGQTHYPRIAPAVMALVRRRRRLKTGA